MSVQRLFLKILYLIILLSALSSYAGSVLDPTDLVPGPMISNIQVSTLWHPGFHMLSVPTAESPFVHVVGTVSTLVKFENHIQFNILSRYVKSSAVSNFHGKRLWTKQYFRRRMITLQSLRLFSLPCHSLFVKNNYNDKKNA